MGLLTVLKKLKQKEKTIRLLMLGLDNAGKTTIVKRFNGEDVSTISPTLGFNIFTLDYGEKKLNLWDIGGQKSLRFYWRNYFEQTDGIIWVIDSADRRRLQDCKDEFELLLQEEKLSGATLLVFANKQDLPGSLTKEEIATMLELDKIVNRHWMIVSCSAITAEGLSEGVEWIVNDISSRIFMLE